MDNIENDDGLAAPPKRPKAWGIRKKINADPAVEYNRRDVREMSEYVWTNPAERPEENRRMAEYGWYSQEVEDEVSAYMIEHPNVGRQDAIIWVFNIH